MAVAYQSVAEAASFVVATSITIDKPSGLSGEDIMVAYLTGGNQYNVPAGWTSQGFQFADSALSDTFTKIADAADVAASNFTFSSGVSNSKGGFIVRVSGGAHSLIQLASDTRTNSNTSPYNFPGLTPNFANSLFLMLAVENGTGGVPDFSGYAITTDNPTWTERVALNDGANQGMTVATATRSGIDATGTAAISITNLTTSSDVVIRILVIPPGTSFIPKTIMF